MTKLDPAEVVDQFARSSLVARLVGHAVGHLHQALQTQGFEVLKRNVEQASTGALFTAVSHDMTYLDPTSGHRLTMGALLKMRREGDFLGKATLWLRARICDEDLAWERVLLAQCIHNSLPVTGPNTPAELTDVLSGRVATLLNGPDALNFSGLASEFTQSFCVAVSP